MDKITNLLDNQPDNEELKTLISQTFLAVDDLQQSFKSQFEIHTNKKPSIILPKGVTEEQYIYARRSEIKFQRFSDGLVASYWARE